MKTHDFKLSLGAALGAALIALAWAAPAARAAEYVPPAGGESVGDLIYRGETFLRERAWSDAISTFEQATALDPKNAEAFRGLAAAHEGAEHWREAAGYYGQVESLAGKTADNSFKMALMYERAGDRTRAASAYEDAAKLDPGNGKAWRALIAIYKDQGDARSQARALEGIIAAQGEAADRLELAGLYETKLGRVDDALKEYKRVVDTDFRNVTAHQRLAAIYMGRKDTVNAAAEYEELSRLTPSEADVFWQLAQCRIALKDESGAVKALEKFVRLRPDDGPGLLLLGTLYNNAGDFNVAERTLKDALGKGDPSADLYCQLGIAQMGLRDPKQAEKSFENALARDNNHALTLERYGELLYRNGDYERAYDLGDRLVTLDRNNLRGHFVRGLAGVATGRFANAEPSLEKVIAAEPSNVEARVGLAAAYVGGGKNREALKTLEVIGSPGDFEDRVYYYQARANEGLKNFDEAAILYDRAEGANPKYYEAFYDHGRMELERANYEPAEKALGRATMLDPKRIDAFLKLGLLFEIQERWSEAANTYVRAREADDGRIEPYLGLGRSYTALKNWGGAEKELRHAITIDAQSFEAHYQLGRLFKAQNRADDAIPEYEEAVLLEPKHVRARTDLGYLYLKKDRYDDAIPVLDKACDLDAKDLDAQYLAGIAYENVDDYPNAIKHYEKASALAPANVEIRKALGTCYRLNRDYDKAIVVFEAVTGEKPDDSFPYEMLGDIYRVKGSEAKRWRRFDKELEAYESASDYYRRYLALAPEAENRAFILKFLDGYEHYRLLQAQEREGVEFYEEW